MARKDRRKKNNTKGIVAAIFFAATILIMCGILYAFWARIILPPMFVEWKEIKLSDSSSQSEIELHNKRVTIRRNGKAIWESIDRMLVSDIMLCDIDYDGRDELILLDWKRGKYGKSRPSWVKRDEIKWSQHISIYELDDMVSPKWMASEIGFDVSGWNFKNGMLVLGDTKGNVSMWRWENWGIYRVQND